MILSISPREVSNGLHKTEGSETKSSVNATHMACIIIIVVVTIIANIIIFIISTPASTPIELQLIECGILRSEVFHISGDAIWTVPGPRHHPHS